MHGEGKKMKVSRAKGRGGLEKFFEFYALLATHFSLCLWLVRHTYSSARRPVRPRGGRREGREKSTGGHGRG